MKTIIFKDGKTTFKDYRSVKGNIHEKINERFEIKERIDFLTQHPMFNKTFKKQ